MKKLSIVVPCLNEEQSLPLFYKEVRKVCQEIPADCEFWFIDDGSSDATLQLIKEFRSVNKAVHYISFSRNFGKEAAMYAGLQAATGDYVAVMDADLQDPPSLLPRFFDILERNEYECVAARRTDRKGESIIKSFLANRFYQLINHISKTNIVPGVRDYRMMNRQMLNAVLSLQEYNRFSKGIFSWVGFRTKYLSYSNVKRSSGKSGWSIFSLFKYATDAIVDFSQAPLSLATWIGGLTSFFAIIGIIIVIIRHLVSPDGSAFGWSSLVCIILFIGGIQLFCLGIVGRYIANIYMQIKNRPLFIIRSQSH